MANMDGIPYPIPSIELVGYNFLAKRRGCSLFDDESDIDSENTTWILSKIFDDESDIDSENTTRVKKLLDGVKGEESEYHLFWYCKFPISHCDPCGGFVKYKCLCQATFT